MTRFETRQADWLSLEEAWARVLQDAKPLASENVPLADAQGRALAEDLIAPVSLPPWDNSAMDGYAVRGEDLEGASAESPRSLRVAGEIRPGERPREGPDAGTAFRIMTGAPIPHSADSVVRVEHTDAEGGQKGVVEIQSDHDRGANVRPAGEDMSRGETLLEYRTSLGPGQIGVLAAAGMRRVRVHRPPRVAILANGDELADLDHFDRVLEEGSIPDTNGPMLEAAVSATGAHPVRLGIARDTESSIREHLERVGDADLLITVGGASMGTGDLFKRVLDQMGFELGFWRVRIRPGSPVSYGHLPRSEGPGDLPVFGLPGNPGSAFVTFQMLVRPFILALGGHRRVHRPRIRAVTAEVLAGKSDLTHLFRVRLEKTEGPPRVALTGPQGSGLVTSLAGADGLAILPEGVGEIPAEQPVEVVLVGDGPGWEAPWQSGG